MADEEILKINVNSEDLPPVLKVLEKISETLLNIEDTTGKAFDKLSSKVSKTNKELSKTEKLFGSIFNKIKLSKLAGGAFGAIKSGAGLASLSLGGIAAGLVGMAVYGTEGATRQIEQSKRWNIRLSQLKALQLTSQKIGKAGSLENVLGNMTQTMRDITKSGAFATLGLSQRELREKDPVKALFEIVDAIKQSPLNNPQNPANFALLKEVAGQMGLQDPDLFLTAIKEGSARMQGLYYKDIKRIGELKTGELEKGEQALIDFRQSLELLSWKMGSAFAPALNSIVNILDKMLPPLADIFSGWIKQFLTPENVDQAFNSMQKLFEELVVELQWVVGSLKGLRESFGGVLEVGDAVSKFMGKDRHGAFLETPDFNKFKEKQEKFDTQSKIIKGYGLDKKDEEAVLKNLKKKLGLRTMQVGTVIIQVANVPKANEVEQLVSGIRAQAMGSLA